MRLSFIAFLAALVGFAFAFGVVVGAYEVFPYRYIKYLINSVEAVVAEKDSLLDGRPVGLLADRRYPGDGIVVSDEARMSPGLTLLSGFFGKLPEIRLIDSDGRVIRSWPVSFSSLFPEPSHIQPASEVPATDLNVAIHGLSMSPDGSLVFNFDAKGAVKLDRCGNTEWALARMTHHSVFRADDGSYWMPSRYWRVDGEGDSRLVTPRWDDTLLHVAADGSVLGEIDLRALLVDNGLYGVLVGNGRFPIDMPVEDVAHLNDIEVLSDEMSSAFPQFSSGDLLLSLRHLNLLLVVRPQTAEVLWYQSGPWLRQHDPDFQPDGTISVFNNNSDDTKDGTRFGGSNLMVADPARAAPANTTVLSDLPPFFTNTQGKHQRLPNGNWLITEYYGGRVIEVAPGGDIVWAYVNGYDEQSVAKISGAIRFPPGYFDEGPAGWRCPAN